MRGRRPAAPEIKKQRGDRKSRINVLAPVFPDAKDATPPDFLTGVEIKKWNEIYKLLSEKGVLKTTDLDVLASYCVAYGAFIKTKEDFDNSVLIIDTPNGSRQAAPELTNLRKSAELLLKLGAELSLTPASRNRVVGVSNDDEALSDIKFLRHQDAKVG